MLCNIRTQHAIGQGFFHSATLQHVKESASSNQPGRMLSYVYDCGAQPTYKTALRSAIDRYHQDKSSATLDLLFVSHIHEDHVNGIPALLNGTKVDTIVMPDMNVVERLIVFAMSLSHGITQDAFYRDLVVNPVLAMSSRFSPRRIIIVRRADDDGPRSEREGRNDDVSSNLEERWTLVGNGRVDRSPPEGMGISNPGDEVWTIDDSKSFALLTDVRTWLLKPYVHPGSVDTTFMSRLAGELKMSDSDLQEKIKHSDFRARLLQQNVSELQSAFGKPKRDLNFTSLCLYSGPESPVESTTSDVMQVVYSPGRRMCVVFSRGVAWLATGDAQLKSGPRLEPFKAHFREFFGQVATLTVPHHGSSGSSRSTLYDAVRPSLCVVAADKYKTWKHPASDVSQAIASAGAYLALVTSNFYSQVTEVIRIPD